MAHFRLWPRGFLGRVTVVLMLAVFVQFFAGSLLIRVGETHVQRRDLGRRIAEQLLIAERIVAASGRSERKRLLENLSTPHTRLFLIEGMPALPPTRDSGSAAIANSIAEFEPDLANYPLRIALMNKSSLDFGREIAGAMQIENDVWIGFRTEDTIADWARLETPLRIGLIALLVLGSAALLVRTLNAPLRRLSANAKLIGTSGRVQFDETTGPLELREVSRTLNEMQERIEGVVYQRTQALLAVGHDLRTPLARLRLRINSFADAPDRLAAEADINQMTRMLQELIDLFGTGDSGQDFAPTDLSSLCQTIGEAFTDQGATVEFQGPDRLVIDGVHDHLARAIENLLDNAVKYAGPALIRLASDDRIAEVSIEDRGPGLSEGEIERVLQPFERLDASRSGLHPGMGLGLSIASKVAEEHGGSLVLANCEGGGLRATLTLEKKHRPATL